MTTPSQVIYDAIRRTMDAEPRMTTILLALANHHGGGGLERGAKASAQSRLDDGEVRTERGLLDRLALQIRRLMKSFDADPARANAVVLAFRSGEGIRVSLLLVRPGDVEKGQYASFQSCTEKEWFDIANGPKPERYPHAKMPHPVGAIIEIRADGTLGDPVETFPPEMDWQDIPLDWNAIPGLPSGMVVPYSTSGIPSPEVDIETHRRIDPFVMDICRAIEMQPPGIRDIRKHGVANGYRDERGNAIE